MNTFFNCILAKTIWMCFKVALGWDKWPTHIQEVFDLWIALQSHNYHIKLFIFSIFYGGSRIYKIEWVYGKSFWGHRMKNLTNFLPCYKNGVYFWRGRCQVPRRHAQENEDVGTRFLAANWEFRSFWTIGGELLTYFFLYF